VSTSENFDVAVMCGVLEPEHNIIGNIKWQAKNDTLSLPMQVFNSKI
jgi:hypothetical protein